MYPKLWNKNFTMVVIGQIISLFGNTVLRFAMNVYILDLTGSAAIFGAVTAFSMIPTIVLSPVGGMLADRANRRNIMVALDFTTAGLCAVFALLLGKLPAIPLFTVVLILLSIIQSFYTPSVQTSVPLLQSDDNIVRGNAIVYQVTMLANLLGPILGGMLYGIWGIEPIIIIGTLCFFVSAVLEIFIRIPFEHQPTAGGFFKTIKSDFIKSMRFIGKEQPSILKVLISVSLFNLFLTAMSDISVSYFVLTTLNLGSKLLGVAQAIMGAGGLAGSILAGVIATKLKVLHLHIVLILGALSILPIAFAFFIQLSHMTIYWILAVCMGLLCMFAMIFSINGLSAIQRQTPTGLQGKVYGYILTLTMVVQPVGHSVYGVLFDFFSTQVYVVLIAALIAAILVGVASRRSFRGMDDEPRNPSLKIDNL